MDMAGPSSGYALSDSLSDADPFTVDETEGLKREDLDQIKARTMFNMVEPLDNGARRLLFLTNAQAELLASSPALIQKMLDALEVPKPSLVIEFLSSWGFRGSTQLFVPEGYKRLKTAAGLIGGRPAFLTRDDEREAEAKLDR